jgi:hypothetical protein
MSEEQMRAELDALRSEVVALRQAMAPEGPTQAAAPAVEPMSRRALLKAAPVAALVFGGVAAAQLATAGPAAADDGDAWTLGQMNVSQSDTILQFEQASGLVLQAGPESLGDGGNIIVHLGGDDPQMIINGAISQGPGDGTANGCLSAVSRAYATTISAQTEAGTAFDAIATEATSTADVVTIENAGLGRSLHGHSTNTANAAGAVTGVNAGSGAGVWGTSGTGDGVVGVSTHGRGGRFRGEDAAINLTPSTASTHPTTGSRGDLFVDSSARLWFCTHASSGAVHATWLRVA